MQRAQRPGRHLGDHLAHIQPDGTGRVEKIAGGKAQARVPDRRVDEEYQADAVHVGQPRMRGEGRGKERPQALIEGVEPERSTDRIAAGPRKQRIQRVAGKTRTGRSRW